MECFRIDESGYTGFDLLNVDQPFQGATALAIGDNDAARLIKEHFPRLQATSGDRGRAVVSQSSGQTPLRPKLPTSRSSSGGLTELARASINKVPRLAAPADLYYVRHSGRN